MYIVMAETVMYYIIEYDTYENTLILNTRWKSTNTIVGCMYNFEWVILIHFKLSGQMSTSILENDLRSDNRKPG